MIHVIRARHAVWAPIMAAVAATVGRGTPIHWAAIRARLGKDPGGEKFCALAARASCSGPGSGAGLDWRACVMEFGKASRAGQPAHVLPLAPFSWLRRSD